MLTSINVNLKEKIYQIFKYPQLIKKTAEKNSMKLLLFTVQRDINMSFLF